MGMTYSRFGVAHMAYLWGLFLEGVFVWSFGDVLFFSAFVELLVIFDTHVWFDICIRLDSYWR
jgi:hypothetical protein